MKKEIDTHKCAKVAGVDGITPQMLKYEEYTVVEKMFMICDFAWRQEYHMSGRRQLLCLCI